MRVEEQWDKVKKAMTEVVTTVYDVTRGKCRQRETWWWCDEVEKAEYKASRNEAKRCIARVQAEVMKKQA